jgi:hypothetical protein
MSAVSVVDLAIADIVDGRPVDWPALESGATDEEREFLECLRILGGLADVHRSTDEEISSVSDSSVEETVERHVVAAAEPFETWGRYRLVQKIGEGSYGSVFRAWDAELEREVAIKILHQRIASGDSKPRLLREGRALAKVRHANVVDVYGIESHGDRLGLCMEFIRGDTLDSVLRTHGTLNAREAMLIAEDVCRALAAVHRAGFVHRDVKARNVMREHGGRVVLMDFGTGRATEQAAGAAAHDVVGTPAYMAPEVLAGAAASAASDVYSVGVLIYHLVTGEYPVEGRTMTQLRVAHAQGRRKLLTERRADLPMPFVQVVERALVADPQQRWPSAAALLQALGALDGSTRLRLRFLLHLGVAASGTFVTLGLLGMLTSRMFNARLGRSEFASETVTDWLVWGLRSCVGPFVYLLMGFAVLGLLGAARRVALATSSGARRLDAAARERVRSAARRFHLDEPSVLASLVLLLAASVLIAAWLHFSPLYSNLFSDFATAPAATLRSIAPVVDGAVNPENNGYRHTFTRLVLVLALVWYLVVRFAAKKGERLHWSLLAGAIATIALALASLDLPFRLFNDQGTQFDTAKWRGQDCYMLGERQDDVLLFCPALQPSRHRIVNKSDQALQRTGVRGSLFASFGENPGVR